MQAIMMKSKGIACCVIVILVLELLPLTAICGKESVRVANVRGEPKDGKLKIVYDLEGPADESFDVRVELCRKGDSRIRYSPRVEFLTGEVGEVSTAGNAKVIVWSYIHDLGEVTGDDYFVKVLAGIHSGKGWIFWFLGVVAVVGGGYFGYDKLFKKESGTTKSEGPFPAEPGRPNSGN